MLIAFDDLVYRYNTSGALQGNYGLGTGNDDPRGITYISTINEVWVVDDIDDRIYRYNTGGVLQGNYALAAGNDDPSGITYISTIDEVWVADSDDNIFRYYTNGGYINHYPLHASNVTASGATYIPTLDEVWVGDSSTDSIFRYGIRIRIRLTADGLNDVLTALTSAERDTARTGLGLQGANFSITEQENDQQGTAVTGDIIIAKGNTAGAPFQVGTGTLTPSVRATLYTLITIKEYNKMENNLRTEVYSQYDKKVWFTSQTDLKLKYVIEGETYIVHYNLSNAIKHFGYPAEQSVDNTVSRIRRYTKGDTIRISRKYSVFSNDQQILKSHSYIRVPFPTDAADYPFYVYVNTDAGETETDEAALRTIVLPPAETTAEWVDRMQPRLTIVARRFVAGVQAEFPHLKTKARNVATGLDDTHAESKRYDNVINWGRSIIGYAWSEMSKWTAPEAQVGVRTPRTDIEVMVDKIEANIPTPDVVEDFYHDHETNPWHQCHAERKIHFANEDTSPGELLFDLQDQATENKGTAAESINHELAETNFKGLVLGEFENAWKSKKRTLITERTIIIPPPPPSSKLYSLVIKRADTGAVLPFSENKVFASDDTSYIVILPAGVSEVAIETRPLEEGATVTLPTLTFADGALTEVREVGVQSVKDATLSTAYTVLFLRQA